MKSNLDNLARRLRRLFLKKVYRHVDYWVSFALLCCIPLATVATVLAIVDFARGEYTDRLIVFILFDFVFFTIVAARLLFALAGMGRHRDPEIRTPLRVTLTRVFALLAFVPTLVIAVVASLVLNVGIGDSLAVEVKEELDRASTASESYASGKVEELRTYATGLAGLVEQEILRYPNLDLRRYRQPLHVLQSQMSGSIGHVFIIDGNCTLIVRGVASYMFNYLPPPRNVMRQLAINVGDNDQNGHCGSDLDITSTGEPSPLTPVLDGTTHIGSIFEDESGTELIAVIRLDVTFDYYLVSTLEVNSSILELRRSLARKTASSRDLVQKITYQVFQYSILYMSLALALVLLMTQLGSFYAQRLSRPVQELARAARQFGEGNREVSINTAGTNEIARLGRAFKLMIDQLNTSINELEKTRNAAEHRERQFRGVLANVTAGVIGLDDDETVVFINRSAGRLLHHSRIGHSDGFDGEFSGTGIRQLVPEFANILDQHVSWGHETSQHQLRTSAAGGVSEFLVRVATRRTNEGGREGFVIAFDDVTDLVRAENKAAWTNVAQQIAHEIKNAMTPILLATGQLGHLVGGRLDSRTQTMVDRYTGRIDDSVSGLIRISDEFSRFAKLPEPRLQRQDILPVLRNVLASEAGRVPKIAMEFSCELTRIEVRIDKDLLNQALTNLLKNASEAIATRMAKMQESRVFRPRIRVEAETTGRWLQICIMDNGTGFPANRDRSHIIRPFVTFREGGTGLGLAYAERIIEGHNGEMTLHDAPVFTDDNHAGAMVRIRLLRSVAKTAEQH